MSRKIKLIAETAFHHQGDFDFMKKLVKDILETNCMDMIKMHMTVNFDEYMHKSHPIYDEFKPKCFSEHQWTSLNNIVEEKNKEILLLFNDSKSIELGMKFNPKYVEIHSICLNDVFLLDCLKYNLSSNVHVVLGVGGCTLNEIESALDYLRHDKIILMFGFQNFPTKYSDINFKKIKKIMKLFPEMKYGYADHTAWNEENNELITLLGAALGMDYIEKHVTNCHGEKRIDYNSAISLKMLKELYKKLNILEKCMGNGLLRLNEGEEKYSIYGPMKKAPLLKSDIKRGEKLTLDKIKFQRTNDLSDLSQIDVLNRVGCKVIKNLKSDSILKKSHFKFRK